jgi:GNAT superfamily N-acetyltransferase
MCDVRDRLVIRPALPGERAALEALQLRSSLVHEAYRDDLAAHPDAIALTAGAIEELRVRVATAVGEDGPVGFAEWSVTSRAEWELEGLFVDPRLMRRGIGGALVEDVLGLAGDGGVTRVAVVAEPDAVGFYERCGFVGEGEVPTRFGAGVRMAAALG